MTHFDAFWSKSERCRTKWGLITFAIMTPLAKFQKMWKRNDSVLFGCMTLWFDEKIGKTIFREKLVKSKQLCSVWLYQTSIGREKFELFSGPTEWREYVSGWGAAVANIFVTFPINKTMFRQMVHGFSTFEALKQLKREGALHLYRGILPPLLQKSSSTAIMFGTYSQYNRLMTNFLGIRNNNQVKKYVKTQRLCAL